MELLNRTKETPKRNFRFKTELESQELRMINSSVLVKDVLEFTNLDQSDVASVLSVLTKSIKEHLLNGDMVNINDLGVLSISPLFDGEREDSDPIFGAGFTLSKELRKQLNG